LSEIKGGENTMNSQIVKLLVFSALFFAIQSATPMLMINNHAGVKTDNITSKPATAIHANTQLTGDPVGGGGFPNVQNITF
jgi:hypothetical protein